ncbi:cytochrome c oxidase subunit 3 [Gloeobacter kilaueensis]|uniref:Oxidase aa(3) subunit 3 n=1 Tax=Gloeobacter kilaueensis (strain ATCC BAA-2537 / CCAP 1431/1 / ULC 316 / JS1) TaxID=1183438 RepID=U5QK16_GLOK1|nr:heme-copper oxidase subunit III [Gloeobacter kilaueensis]AGY59271.1 cytochrome c oxidase subunit III [Gloeobacter kilaueensis JS1]
MDTPAQPAPIASAHHEEPDNRMFGVTILLLSESMLFFVFFAAYVALRLTSPRWLPAGVDGLEVIRPAINTVVLVSSSFVIFFAEKALERNNLTLFRGLLLLTSAMGGYFLLGQAIEWRSLPFGLTTGQFGSTFYLLTGFHGLHVLVGILLQLGVFARSFVAGLYTPEKHFGLSAASLFWHFVDVIWLILFALLYLWQSPAVQG